MAPSFQEQRIIREQKLFFPDQMGRLRQMAAGFFPDLSLALFYGRVFNKENTQCRK
jgi:hypothetical protein